MLSKHSTLDSFDKTFERFLKLRSDFGYGANNKSSVPQNEANMLPYISKLVCQLHHPWFSARFSIAKNSRVFSFLRRLKAINIVPSAILFFTFSNRWFFRQNIRSAVFLSVQKLFVIHHSHRECPD